MGMPNIPKEILAEMNIDKDDVLKIFCESFEKNKDSFHKFFQSEKDFRRIFEQIPPKDKKKVKDSFCDIKTILNEKDKDINEKLNKIQHLYDEHKNNRSFSPIILFIILSIILYYFHQVK